MYFKSGFIITIEAMVLAILFEAVDLLMLIIWMIQILTTTKLLLTVFRSILVSSSMTISSDLSVGTGECSVETSESNFMLVVYWSCYIIVQL